MRGKFSKIIAMTCLLALLSTSVATSSWAADAAPASRCSRFLKVARDKLTGILFGTLIIFAPGVYREAGASYRGADHIGYGIMLDMDRVHAELTPEQRGWFADPQAHEKQIAEMLTKRLAGDFDHDLADTSRLGLYAFFEEPRDATEYFSGRSDRRGICRHKALILHKILDHLGIANQVRIGHSMKPEGEDHMWIYLPTHGLALDPTSGFIGTPEEHKERVLVPERLYEDPTAADVSWLGRWITK